MNATDIASHKEILSETVQGLHGSESASNPADHENKAIEGGNLPAPVFVRGLPTESEDPLASTSLTQRATATTQVLTEMLTRHHLQYRHWGLNE